MALNEDAIRAFLRERGAGPHVVRGGAEYLLAEWRRFVAQVKEGYPLGLEEYCNDLDIRTLIELAGLSSQVGEEDREFRALLVRPDREIWESDAPNAFWVRGYPANASGQLLADLRAGAGI